MVNTSNNLGFLYTAEGQQGKTTVMNNALSLIDGLINTGVEDRDLDTAPALPEEGAVYIVKAPGAGDGYH